MEAAFENSAVKPHSSQQDPLSVPFFWSLPFLAPTEGKRKKSSKFTHQKQEKNKLFYF
jgi:hypothetical protein